MNEVHTDTLASIVRRINRLQDMGVFPGCFSISNTGGKPSVFFINGGLEALPDGKRVFKSRDDDYWPWECTVKKDGIEYKVWLEKDDCWPIYLDFAA